jgi:predicted Zn-dependent peptidase
MLGKGGVLAWLLVAGCLAQEPAPESRATSRPPVEFRLTAGVRVRLVPIGLPGEVAVILGIHGAGMLAEPAGVPHLAHISEHAIFHSIGHDEGGKLVDEWLAEGRANAETLPDLMYFDLSPPAGAVGSAIAIQYRRFTGGYATPAVMDREIPRALSEVTGLEAARTERRDLLGKFAWSAFTQIALRGTTDVPFKEKTLEIGWGMVDAFRQRTFYPGSAMLTVVGDIDPDEVRSMINPSWTGQQREHKAERRPALRPGSLKGSWDVASHQFFMAWEAPPPADRAHPALTVFSRVLAGSLMASADLRRLTRGVAAAEADAGGLFVIHVPLKSPARGEDAAAEIRKIIAAFGSDGAPSRAITGAQAAVRELAGLVPKVTYPPNIPRKILVHANLELWRMRATLAWDQAPEDYCARADKIGAADIKAAIKTWLAPDKAAIVTIIGKE